MPLKYKVQLLIKADWLDFNRNNRPNVTTNLLPNHIGPDVNAVIEESCMRIKIRVDEVKLSMDEVYKEMVRMRAIPEIKVFEGNCAIAKRQV